MVIAFLVFPFEQLVENLRRHASCVLEAGETFKHEGSVGKRERCVSNSPFRLNLPFPFDTHLEFPTHPTKIRHNNLRRCIHDGQQRCGAGAPPHAYWWPMPFRPGSVVQESSWVIVVFNVLVKSINDDRHHSRLLRQKSWGKR